MDRSAYQDLKRWKSSASRKPLLVQGARQVGKTFLLRQFAGSEYADCAYFNFEESPRLASLFDGDLHPAKIVESLSAFQAKTILPGTTLLFLDEIQACPRALTSLKYFCEQAPHYHIVAAGSLLGVSVGKTSSFPVGKVNFLTLYPLSFLEFAAVMGEERLCAMLHENVTHSPLPDALHEKLNDLLRHYLFLGGMPEVVQSYVTTGDIVATRGIQKEILKAYEPDFSKYTTPVQAIRIAEIWRSIPSHLARENKKFRYSSVKKHGRASHFESAIEWLRGAGLIYVSVNVTTAKLPLAGFEDSERFKVYVLDCGLLGAMIDVPPRVILLGDGAFSEYNGAFVENLVASELARGSEGSLHYWLSEGIAEVDFLVAHEQAILPLEVKSGLNRNVKGLRIYASKFNPTRIYRASPRNFYRSGDFVNIPLYSAGLLRELHQGNESDFPPA